MGIVIRGRGVIIQVGTHSASCLRVALGRRLWAPGHRPIVVDVGCRSVVVGPRLPLTAWHPHGRSWVVWAVAVRGWVMVGGVCGWLLSVGGQFSSSGGSCRPFVGGRCSWVDGCSWVAEIIVRGWGMVVASGGVVVHCRGVMGVCHPESSCRRGMP